MKTKKAYMEPEMKTVVMSMPMALMAGSGENAGVGPSGEDWMDD